MKKWVMLILTVVLSMATVVPVKAFEYDSLDELLQMLIQVEEFNRLRESLHIVVQLKKGQHSIKLNRSKIAPTINYSSAGTSIRIIAQNKTSVFMNGKAMERVGILGDKTVELTIKDQPLNKLSKNVQEGLKEYNNYTVLAFTDIEIKNGTEIIEALPAPFEVSFEFPDLGLTEEDFENIVCLSIDKDGVATEIAAKLNNITISFDIYNFNSVGLIQLK